MVEAPQLELTSVEASRRPAGCERHKQKLWNGECHGAGLRSERMQELRAGGDDSYGIRTRDREGGQISQDNEP